MPLARTQRVAHIIDNDDVALTYCGLMLAVPADPTDTAAIRVLTSAGPAESDYAIFDDVEIPHNDWPCIACHDRYNR